MSYAKYSQPNSEHGSYGQARYSSDYSAGRRTESLGSECHIPIPSQQNEASAGRNRSESNGIHSMRSSGDRAHLTTMFDTRVWQRISSNLPSSVRDPLNMDELEREERLHSSVPQSLAWNTADGMPEKSNNSNRISEISANNFISTSAPPLVASGSEKPPIDWAFIQDHNLRNGGLPTLDQVLTRKTCAPLALRDFAVHCSVRQPQARRWLEFYMAARTHEKMCLAYESDLRNAKARSHYASGDSKVLPERLLSSIAAATNSKNDQQRMSKFSDISANPLDTEVRSKEDIHKATVASLSRGRSMSNKYEDDDDGILGDKSAFKHTHGQSTRMALQIQTAAETIFLRYFRAALDPNLLEYGNISYWQGASSSSDSSGGIVGHAYNPNRRGLGPIRRMLTQKVGGNVGPGGVIAGGPGTRKNHPTGLRLAPSALRPNLNDPYHQGYGVEATDSVYNAATVAATGAPQQALRKNSGAGSQYNNITGELASPNSLAGSHEYLYRPITANIEMNDGMGGYFGGHANAALNQHQQEQRYLRLNETGGLRMLGTLGGARHHLYYHMPWPPEILTDIEQRLLHDGAALDPHLFSEALIYAYDVLDTYYFPIFINDATSRNVTQDHCVLRIFIGFLLLWFGFALPLAFILLDHEPKATRIWCLVPLLIGWWNMAVGFGGCDILLALVKQYQSPMLRANGSPTSSHNAEVDRHASRDTFDSVGEKKSKVDAVNDKIKTWRKAWFTTRPSVDLTATRMVRARAIRWFFGALFMTAVSTAILCSVPGTRVYKD